MSIINSLCTLYYYGEIDMRLSTTCQCLACCTNTNIVNILVQMVSNLTDKLQSYYQEIVRLSHLRFNFYPSLYAAVYWHYEALIWHTVALCNNVLTCWRVVLAKDLVFGFIGIEIEQMREVVHSGGSDNKVKAIAMKIWMIESLPVSKTSHTKVMFVPGSQTKYLRLTAAQITLCYPGNGHPTWFTLTKPNQESPRSTLS